MVLLQRNATWRPHTPRLKNAKACRMIRDCGRSQMLKDVGYRQIGCDTRAPNPSQLAVMRAVTLRVPSALLSSIFFSNKKCWQTRHIWWCWVLLDILHRYGRPSSASAHGPFLSLIFSLAIHHVAWLPSQRQPCSACWKPDLNQEA